MRERVLGDRLLVAAGLIEAEHAGLGAGLQVHGVVARAVGRDDQQALRAAQQVRAGVIFLGEFVARRADLIGMRAGEDRGRGVVRAVVLEHVEAHVGALLNDSVKIGWAGPFTLNTRLVPSAMSPTPPFSL